MTLTVSHTGRVQTLEQPLELGTVHVDVLNELDVVDIYCVFRADSEFL